MRPHQNIVPFLIFPDQLFKDAFKLPRQTPFYIVESAHFFTNVPFHKQKLVLHRASMQAFRERLLVKGFQAEYIEAGQNLRIDDVVVMIKKIGATKLKMYEPADMRIRHEVTEAAVRHDVVIDWQQSPGFFLKHDEAVMLQAASLRTVYQSVRTRHNLLMEDGKPVGGKWQYVTKQKTSLDAEAPEVNVPDDTRYEREAITYVQKHFSRNPGSATDFFYPVTYADAEEWLEDFVEQRLPHYAEYADTVVVGQPVLFHSLLSPLINCGLLTPSQIWQTVERAFVAGQVTLAASERFLRALAGQREYLRAWATHSVGTPVLLPLTRVLHTGLQSDVAPLFTQVLHTAYLHSAERALAVAALKHAKTPPEEIRLWLLSYFIDSYLWNLPQLTSAGASESQ